MPLLYMITCIYVNEKHSLLLLNKLTSSKEELDIKVNSLLKPAMWSSCLRDTAQVLMAFKGKANITEIRKAQFSVFHKTGLVTKALQQLCTRDDSKPENIIFKLKDEYYRYYDPYYFYLSDLRMMQREAYHSAVRPREKELQTNEKLGDYKDHFKTDYLGVKTVYARALAVSHMPSYIVTLLDYMRHGQTNLLNDDTAAICLRILIIMLNNQDELDKEDSVHFVKELMIGDGVLLKALEVFAAQAQF